MRARAVIIRLKIPGAHFALLSDQERALEIVVCARYLRQPLTHTRSGTFPSLAHSFGAPPSVFAKLFSREPRLSPCTAATLPRNERFHPPRRRPGGETRRTAQTRPNVISISCSRTRARSHISDTVGQAPVGARRAAPSRRMHSRSAAMHFSWLRGGGKGRGTMERPAACGLSTADGWTPTSSRLDWCRPCPRVEIPRTSKYFISARARGN